MWFSPGMAGPPVHVHPGAEETFTVLEGAKKITALPPRNAKSAIYAAMLFTKSPDEIVAVGPQRPIFRALALAGRALGWRV